MFLYNLPVLIQLFLYYVMDELRVFYKLKYGSVKIDPKLSVLK
jgi:hypothetical protein